MPIDQNVADALKGLRVLAVTPVSDYGGINTSIDRIRALEFLGCNVKVIDSTRQLPPRLGLIHYRVRNRLFRMGLPISIPDLGRDAPRLLAAASADTWDLIWLEKALTLGAEDLRALRSASPESLIVGFSPDDMNGRHNQTQQFLRALPHYDAFLSTKSYNVAELQRLGCPTVAMVGNGYDPTTFRPIAVSDEERTELGGEIGFIGSYEEERAQMMHFLADGGLSVRIWGSGWSKMRQLHANLRIENRAIRGDDFAKACGAFKINLGFLRKMNRDLQTTRSVEIPACGGFMLSERTHEHLEMFLEGQEAEFFNSPEELIEKCRYYLQNEPLRQRIARAGHQRCLSSDYSNAGRLAAVLPALLSGDPR